MSSYQVVAIAYKRPDLIEALLARLAQQTIPPSRVIVVDNGGDLPRSVVDAAELEVPVIVIPRPDNPGYSAAVNEARRLGPDRTERVLVLTHDAVFDAHLAETLLRPIDDDPAIGAAGPMLMRASRPTEVFSAGGRLTRGGRAAHLVHRPKVSASSPWDSVDWLDGAIVMYRTAALDAIDWLDESYFLYFEDVDTAWRMRRAGFDTVLCVESQSFQEPGAHPTYLGIRNMTLFGRKAGIPPIRSAASVARRVAEESAVALMHGSPPPLGSAFRGWRDGRRGVKGKPTLS